MFNDLSTSASGVYCRRQPMHKRRTSLWATTPISAEPVTNGSTPISVSRVIVDGASSV